MGFSKNSRSGKRPSNSSSSYLFSTVTMVVIIAFCLLGLWVLTSSSVIPPQTQKKTFSTVSRYNTEKIPDNYDSKGSSSGWKAEEDLGRRALRSPTEIEEEERRVEQEIENDDGERSENGGGGKAGGGEMEDDPREEVQQEDDKQQSTEGVEHDQEQGSVESDKGEEKTEESVQDENQQQSQIEEVVENEQLQTDDNAGSQGLESAESQQSPSEENGENPKSETEEMVKDPNSNELLPDGAESEILKETNVEQGSWATQADQSENEKERQKANSASEEEVINEKDGSLQDQDGANYGYRWELCNVTAGPDFIPCLDNEKAIKQLHSTKHYEHRERHCPDEGPTCLVPLPKGYKRSIGWPKSRDKIWYNNVPNTMLADVKGHQNWVKVSGEYLTFPGGGTQFIHGALHYIDFIQQSVPSIAWGKRTRVILDVGCGVASFGGYLFERNVLTMSFAPKDEHEAQVQFALERGIPAISAVMGSQRLPFPSGVFDIVHCARCRVPWHAEGGALLLELNRVLRPGGYFVWSATPVYQKLKEDVEIWKAMISLTISMCWDLFTIKKDKLNSVGAAIYRKPTSNECYESRKHNNPPMCEEKDDPDAAWYVPLQACMHRVPEDKARRGSKWPGEWPVRLQTPPYWLNKSQVGVYGRPAPEDFASDSQHWKQVVTKSYLNGLGIDWSTVRNVMDMKAVYGGFAAALKDLKVWVMNVVNIDSPDTLPIIYERGLFGIYHDWCESFSTYPRTYDLLHADRLFSSLKERCNIVAVMAEIDRILRPGGKLIVRDESSSVSEIETLVKSLRWEVRLTFSKDNKGILCAQKSDWRPDAFSGLL